MTEEQAAEIAAIELSQSCALPFTLRAVILLGVPDILNGAGRDAKLTAEEIASHIASASGTRAHAENLERLLRQLASHNVVTELVSASPNDPKAVERRYGTTPVLKCLTNNKDGVSLASLVLIHTDTAFASTLQYLHAPVLEKNVLPYVLTHGKSVWEYMETDEKFDKLFNKCMAHTAITFASALLQNYTGFEGLRTLVDVGGNIGATLAHILPRYPNLRGINFDQPHVVAKGIQATRLGHVGGNFFENVPEGDAVFMKWILHDWSDEACVRILKNIAKAIPPHGKVINMDVVLPEVSDSSTKSRSGFSCDLLMMAYNDGGKERTFSQFQKIAGDSGFPRVVLAATAANQGVLEFYKS